MPLKLDEKFGFEHLFPIVKPKIIAMIKEYRANLQSLSNASLSSRFGPGISESNYAIVSINELQSFFAANPTADMVRIHFAAHDTSTMSDLGMELQGQLTVILVSAKATYDANGKITNLDDLLNDDPKLGPVDSVSMSLNFQGMGDDQYPLCPPNCPPGHIPVP